VAFNQEAIDDLLAGGKIYESQLLPASGGDVGKIEMNTAE
jgi:hypothetical protein